MITFKDGPAAGKTLAVRSAPILLRAVRAPDGTWDALDQPNDQPRPDEFIAVYRRDGEVTTAHINRGRAGSGWYALADYVLHDRQPDDATASDGAKWRAWAASQIEAPTLLPAEPGSRPGAWSLYAPAERPLAPATVVNVKTAKADEYIGRAMPKQGYLHGSDWANEFKPESDSAEHRAIAIRKYVLDLLEKPMRENLQTLAGKSLGCWCAPRLCHGDALVELLGLIRFAGAKCPYCDAKVASFLNWHTLGMTEAWICSAKACGRRGHRARPTPSCLLTPQPLLL